jgi:hypothetical protein
VTLRLLGRAIPVYIVAHHIGHLAYSCYESSPGEPIVEMPERAIEFLLAKPLDALYLDGWRVERASL